MFDVLFAWSWGGHGQITTAAMATAVAGFTALGKTALTGKMNALALAGKWENLFTGLPDAVQLADIHAGNIPWGVGEFFDDQGQVRHFMRSTEAVSSRTAYDKSMGWIRGNMLLAWDLMRRAIDHKPGFFDALTNPALSDFSSGEDNLAKALHAAEDSYAQGHVTRDPGNTNYIREVLYWSEANKKGDPAAGRLSHEEYDDPGRGENKTYLAAAKVTAGELILCLLAHLDEDKNTFTTELDQLLKIRFVYGWAAGDFSAPGGNTGTG